MPDRPHKRTRDADHFPGDTAAKQPKGHDARSLGPSNSSDSGSDLAGPGLLDSDQLGLDRGTNEDVEAGHLDTADAGADVGDLGLDESTDREGTGEHLTAGREPDVRIGADIGTDRIVGPEEAGLGGGLDQAEEAQLGVTDEELAEMAKRRRSQARP
jgi:hypothetical protein